MIKTEREVIDDLEFQVVQFPAMYALGLMARLLKCVGPALAAFNNFSPDTPIAETAPALVGVFAGLDPVDAQKLVLEILKSTSVILEDGKRIEFSNQARVDEFFTGRMLLMFKVIALAARTNFQDFMGGSALAAKTVPSALTSRS